MWECLTDIAITRDEAWFLVGDFNELMNNGEKLGGTTRNASTFSDFRNMAENCKIKEIKSSGNWFSWAGWRDNIWIQCHLDRSFANDGWFKLFLSAKMQYLEMLASDHKPIKITFNLEIAEPSYGRFYFDKRMLKKGGIEDVVKRSWCGENSASMSTINRCRRELSRWKKSMNLNSRNRIQHLQYRLEAEISKCFPSRRSMQHL